MSNGGYILKDLDFEDKIENMDDRKLLEFTARLSYSNAIRIMTLERRGKRTIGSISGISAMVGAAFVGAIDYFLRR